MNSMVGNNMDGIKPGVLLLMILGCCLLLANLYYSQPILAEISAALAISQKMAGSVITMSQIGYIVGLLFLAPLGDFIENRKLCAAMVDGAACASFLAAITNNATIFLCAILLVGIFASATQILVVFAVSLAGTGKSGRILGIMACGLFLGIAASRPVSSFLTSLWGWRSVYLISAICLFAVSVATFYFLPSIPVNKKGFGYGTVLRSMLKLVKFPRLLQRSLISGGTFFSFILFWSATPMYLANILGFSQNSITVFTFAGLVTPPCMLLVGKLLDKGYHRQLILTGLCLVLGGWIMIALGPAWLCLFIGAALLLDPFSSTVTVSVQQTILSTALLEVRGRLNSLNISMNFFGGAAGGAMGPWLLINYGYMAVILVGACVISALAIFALITGKKDSKGE